jgi:hypothetical protein
MSDALNEKGAAVDVNANTNGSGGAAANELAVLGYHQELKRNRTWLTILSQSLVISSVTHLPPSHPLLLITPTDPTLSRFPTVSVDPSSQLSTAAVNSRFS